MCSSSWCVIGNEHCFATPFWFVAVLRLDLLYPYVNCRMRFLQLQKSCGSDWKGLSLLAALVYLQFAHAASFSLSSLFFLHLLLLSTYPFSCILSELAAALQALGWPFHAHSTNAESTEGLGVGGSLSSSSPSSSSSSSFPPAEVASFSKAFSSLLRLQRMYECACVRCARERVCVCSCACVRVCLYVRVCGCACVGCV